MGQPLKTAEKMLSKSKVRAGSDLSDGASSSVFGKIIVDFRHRALDGVHHLKEGSRAVRLLSGA